MIEFKKAWKMIMGTATPIAQALYSLRGVAFLSASFTMVDGATITPDGSTGENFVFTAPNNNVRAFQVPTNMPVGAVFTITVINTSGGAIGNTTFAAGYHGIAPVLPATGNQRMYMFRWDGAVANFMVQTAADSAN